MRFPTWLSQAVFYNIYPQSFLDSNSDGIGDLAGIVSKLDYIATLGCNAIWLNPIYESPFGDAGYDVSDYYKVAERYGSNDDAKKLFAAAHERGMKVCLDLVAGHTSIAHRWFQESSKQEDNQYSNRYIWTDSMWEDVDVASSFIKGFAQRDGAYMANFFWFQPALNYGYANPDPHKPWQLPINHPDALAMRKELENIMRFWLDMGADGFRVDMASTLVKEGPDKKATISLWQDVRKMFEEEYPEAVLISEWSDPIKAIEAGFHIDFMLHFNVDPYLTLFRAEKWHNPHEEDRGPSWFDGHGEGDASRFFTTYMEHYRATKGKGYISLPTGSNDMARLASGRSLPELKVALGLLLSMPGIPFIYYGDEIGMVGGSPDLPSKEGGYNRTLARTPMRWDGSANRGFSTAEPKNLYLPLDDLGSDVSTQSSDPESLLSWIKALTTLRAKKKALGADGNMELLPGCGTGYPLGFLRSSTSLECSDSILVVLNPSPNPGWISLPQGIKVGPVLLHSGGIEIPGREGGNSLLCKGMSFAILSLEQKS